MEFGKLQTLIGKMITVAALTRVHIVVNRTLPAQNANIDKVEDLALLLLKCIYLINTSSSVRKHLAEVLFLTFFPTHNY